MSNRTFGVEIECNIPSVVRNTTDSWGYRVRDYPYSYRVLREEFENAGLNVRSGYSSEDEDDYYGDPLSPPDYWYLGSDGSLGENGFEITTPALSGEDGFKELQKGFELIFGTLEGNVDHRCGMHVHHGASDYAENEAATLRLLETWLDNQSNIHHFVDSSRPRNGYCGPISWRDVDAFKSGAGFYAFSRKEIYLGNLGGNRKTIEIRLHEGTNEFEIAESWVRFTQKMLDDVMRRVNPVSNVEDPIALMKRFKVRRSTMRTLARKANIEFA